jgi:hypothetical protein
LHQYDAGMGKHIETLEQIGPGGRVRKAGSKLCHRDVARIVQPGQDRLQRFWNGP